MIFKKPIIAIVGSSKIPSNTIALQKVIMKIMITHKNATFISGEAPGVDHAVKYCATILGKHYKPYPPKTLNWEGYKARNLEMARDADKVYVIALKGSGCYHHDKVVRDHDRTGGCYTAKYAKEKELIIL